MNGKLFCTSLLSASLLILPLSAVTPSASGTASRTGTASCSGTPSWTGATARTGTASVDRTSDPEIEALISQMTLDEKIGMVHANRMFSSAGVPRLGIPDMWYSDGPHGVRWEGEANGWKPIGWPQNNDACSYLPALSALAATWNKDLARQYGEVIGTESRVRGKTVQLAPGVNITRSVLNGRTWEYFSEDPCLTSELAVPYIEGVQSRGVAACVKHYALNSQADDQYWISSEVDERALREIYLPAFEAAVKRAGVMAMMPGYNKVRGRWCSENSYLLDSILRREWGFEGIVVSDWNGVHSTVPAALAGTDVEMGTAIKENGLYAFEKYYFAAPLKDAVLRGEVPESVLDGKVRRILALQKKLGRLSQKPYDTLGMASKLAVPAHADVALRVAEESVVLLKNQGGMLPLKPQEYRKVAVIGANASTLFAPGGGSTKLKAKYEVSALEGIRTRFKGCEIEYAPGFKLLNRQYKPAVHRFKDEFNCDFPELRDEALRLASEADLVIYVGGLTHEHGMDCEGYDRPDMKLPYRQDELISAILKVNPRTVVVLMAGSPVEPGSWYDSAPAVLQCSFLGMEGGNALARILCGDVCPSGKLSNTWAQKLGDYADQIYGEYPGNGTTVRFNEGIMVGYRHFEHSGIKPRFEFGYGLSYTSFEYSDLSVRPCREGVRVSFRIRNSGPVAGKETAQVYVSQNDATLIRPVKELKDFVKIDLKPGESRRVSLILPERAFQYWDDKAGAWSSGKGNFTIRVGASSADIRLVSSLKR